MVIIFTHAKAYVITMATINYLVVEAAAHHKCEVGVSGDVKTEESVLLVYGGNS